MTASLVGVLTPDSQHIALVASGADDWDMREIGPRLDQLTATAAHPRRPDGTIEKDVLLVPATWPTVIQLGRLFNGNGSGVRFCPDERLIEFMVAEDTRRRGTPPPLPDDAVPPWLALRDYQREDAAALAAAGKVLLLHSPGLGKTVITIAGLEARRLNGHGLFPMIIVVPSWVVARVWTDHIREWAGGWPEPLLYAGTDRARDLAWLKQQRGRDWILVTTYATLRRDAKTADDVLPRCAPETVIADEAHLTGNGDSAQSKAVVRTARHAQSVVLASGTLITRSMRNVHPALKALDPGSWPSWTRIRPRYIATRRADHPGGEEIVLGLRTEMQDEFFACLDGQILRRRKDDVLAQLPPKIYSVRHPVMPAEWRHAYDTMRDQMLAELPDGGVLPVMGSLALFGRLSQMASSAADVRVTMELSELTGELVPHYHVTLKRPSWKAEAFLGLMAEREGMPTAVFAESRQLAMITGEDCLAAGLRTGFVTGDGDGPATEITGRPGYRITPGTKDHAVADFQAGKLDVICCTAGAGGLGITLTAASCLAMLQRPLRLDLALQPEDRCMTAGTPVLTPGGWIPVEDIRSDDMVITHTGEAQPVTDTWSRIAQHGKVMAEISVTGQEPVTCTADHPFLLQSGQWREAGDLKLGDWLAMPGNGHTAELGWLTPDSQRIATEFFHEPDGVMQRNGRLRSMPGQISVTDDFLFACGYFAGDGFASTGNGKGRFISFSGNPGSKAAALDRCALWARSVSLNGSPSVSGNSVEWRFYSGDWAYWFRDAFGHGARSKHLPAWALELNERQSRIILDGLAASDGYRRKDRPARCEYVTVSPILAANVLQLATRAGYRPSSATGSTGQYIIAFGGRPGPKSAGRVRSILLRYAGRQERIFDITVKEARTFVAGGIIVHNSHRLGSEIHEHVEIIDFVTDGTIDEHRRALLRGKAGQWAQLIREPGFVRALLGGLK